MRSKGKGVRRLLAQMGEIHAIAQAARAAGLKIAGCSYCLERAPQKGAPCVFCARRCKPRRAAQAVRS